MTSIDELFKKIFIPWALGETLHDQNRVEAISPILANVFSVKPKQFTFDKYFHTERVQGWEWNKIIFADIFEGFFSFYFPTQWKDINCEKSAATVSENNVIHQSIFLMEKKKWALRLKGFFEKNSIIGFAYEPLFLPGYIQWLFITQQPGTSESWIWGVFSSGEWVVIVKGDASDKEMLEIQITSILNSNPWYGWIEAAKKQYKDRMEEKEKMVSREKREK